MHQVSHLTGWPALLTIIRSAVDHRPSRAEWAGYLYPDRMSRLTSALRTRALAAVYPVFYRLPHRMRMWLVRWVAPTYTVGAVVLVRDAYADRLLLLRQPPGRGWSLPAGLLARGESPVEGAVRELAEESGIVLPPERLRPAVPNALVHHRGRWVDLVFEATVVATATRLRVDGREVLEAAWHEPATLPPLTRPTAQLLGCYGIGPLAEPPAGPQPAAKPEPAAGPEPEREPGPA
jgi:ADP-ribose pyrophosphatase YjhB (NUDIX family)